MTYLAVKFLFSLLLQNNFFSPEVFGRIIYEHYLFDLPRLLDLCSVYGSHNQRLLAKMVANIFEKQPKYLEDWESMVGSIVMEVFSKVEGKVLSPEGSYGAMRLDNTIR